MAMSIRENVQIAMTISHDLIVVKICRNTTAEDLQFLKRNVASVYHGQNSRVVNPDESVECDEGHAEGGNEDVAVEEKGEEPARTIA